MRKQRKYKKIQRMVTGAFRSSKGSSSLWLVLNITSLLKPETVFNVFFTRILLVEFMTEVMMSDLWINCICCNFRSSNIYPTVTISASENPAKIFFPKHFCFVSQHKYQNILISRYLRSKMTLDFKSCFLKNNTN